MLLQFTCLGTYYTLHTLQKTYYTVCSCERVKNDKLFNSMVIIFTKMYLYLFQEEKCRIGKKVVLIS